MEVLTYTLYKEHCELYTEIHNSIAVNSCQINLARKDMILLSNIAVILYKSRSRTSVENKKFIHFNFSPDTYSTDDFNAKIKLAVLQQRQDWEPPQIKDLKLVIPDHYTFMASNTIFIALGMLDNYIEKTMPNKSTLPPGSCKTSLDTLPPTKSLSLHCKQINKVKNELDGQPSGLLAYMHVSNCKATSYSMRLVFFKLDTHRPPLDVKILDENDHVIIPRTSYLQLLNK